MSVTGASGGRRQGRTRGIRCDHAQSTKQRGRIGVSAESRYAMNKVARRRSGRVDVCDAQNTDHRVFAPSISNLAIIIISKQHAPSPGNHSGAASRGRAFALMLAPDMEIVAAEHKVPVLHVPTACMTRYSLQYEAQRRRTISVNYSSAALDRTRRSPARDSVPLSWLQTAA
jgi:hypothetical protein